MRANLPILLAGALLGLPAAAQQPGAPKGTGAGDSEKLEAAADNIGRMKAALKQTLTRAEQARGEKDVVKLNCVNEKLTQIKALLRVAEQADVSLHETVAANSGGGEADFSKIAIARTKVDGLRADSEHCVGQLAYMVDEKTTVEVELPPGIGEPQETGLGVARRGENPAERVPAIDARNEGFAPVTIVRPPAASPYR
jgi:hypothetical protein